VPLQSSAIFGAAYPHGPAQRDRPGVGDRYHFRHLQSATTKTNQIVRTAKLGHFTSLCPLSDMHGEHQEFAYSTHRFRTLTT
jgi:hypothetical protein